jgi:hypothetical protein
MDLSQLGMAQRQAMQQASAGELAGALGIDSQMLANIQAMAGVSAPAGSVAPQEGAGAKALTAFVGELGGALGEGMKWSDRRLKTNIKQVGMHPVGVPRYKFDYIWGESSSGVMAQDLLDVMPEAILRVGDFYAVNYDMIGGH